MTSIYKNAINNYLAPIKELLEDERISEVMINGPHEIFVEVKGLVKKVPNKFRDEMSLQSAINAIAQSVGRVIDDANPRLDARLPDGSRIHAVLPPMAAKGTTVAIRKFSKESLTLKDLINFGSLNKTAARFLDICVYLGKNIIVSGGTGSGKTALLNVLGSRTPKSQRLLVIEDASELQIKLDHVVNFEARYKNEERGVTQVSIRDLVKSAMRLRPDRIIIGEVRGAEALDLIQIMNTGHDGSMGTVHSNNPSEACIRLETLALMGDTKIPPDSIKKMLANAVDIIVQCQRYHDGKRRISHISEVLGIDNYGNYITRDIFRWIQRGKDKETGVFIGETVACNYLPTFFNDIVVNEIDFSKSNFVSPEWAKSLVVKKVA